MLIPYEYTYLFGDFVYFIPWMIFFLLRKDLRAKMMGLGIGFGINSLLLEPFTYHDWWRPLTITGTIPGIEDFLFGFFTTGVAAVAYQVFFNKKIMKPKTDQSKEKIKRLIFLLVTGYLLFFTSIIILKLPSFYASMIAMTVVLAGILYQREDLTKTAVASAFLTLVIGFTLYWIINLFSPGWIDAFWLFTAVPRVMIFSLPIDDIIWFPMFGALVSVMYEYYEGASVK